MQRQAQALPVLYAASSCQDVDLLICPILREFPFFTAYSISSNISFLPFQHTPCLLIPSAGHQNKKMSSPAASPLYSTWGITAFTSSLIGGAVFYLPQCLLNSRAQGREVLHGRAPEADTVGYAAQVSWLAERFLSLRDAAAVLLGGQGGVLVTLFEAALSSARMAGLSALMAAFVGLWAVSTYLGDVSIVDSLWSLGTKPLLFLHRDLCPPLLLPPAGFLLLTWVYNQHPDTMTGFAGRKQLILGGVALWAVRLAGYIAWRNHGQGEGTRNVIHHSTEHGVVTERTYSLDYRYKAMRKSMGPKFWWVSLFSVFGLQAVRYYGTLLSRRNTDISSLLASVLHHLAAAIGCADWRTSSLHRSGFCWFAGLVGGLPL